MKSLKYLGLLILILPLIFSCSNSTTTTNTVATPEISPDGGTYTSPQSVTVSITCNTAAATIKYTTDAALADSLWGTYTGPLTINSTTTVKARAEYTGWNDSGVISRTFDFDYMVTVASGTFNMGRTVGTSTYTDEVPVHPITVSSFMISKYEVTQAEWDAYMDTNPSFFDGDSRPVEMVRWYETLVYCNKRSIAEGLTPAYTINGSTSPSVWGSVPVGNDATWNAVTCNWAANGYRLPTEAEWEFAARGGVTTPDYIYAGSNDLNLVGWYDANSTATSHVVGGKTDNGLGLYDMSGNVQEWVWDWYSNTYYSTLSTTTATSNPTGPANDGNNRKVERGGSWNQGTIGNRIAFRNWGNTDNTTAPVKVKDSFLGFRVVRSN